MSGLNCAPVAVRGTKAEFLDWIGAGFKRGQIQIPAPRPGGHAAGLLQPLESSHGNHNTRRIFPRVLGRNREPILTTFPAFHAPGDPVSPILGKLLRKPFAAQEVAIAGAVERLRGSQFGRHHRRDGHRQDPDGDGDRPCIRGRPPCACLFVVPPQLLQKTAREILQTIPGARVYVIDSLRSQRPGQAGPHGVNEFRLRNGRIIRDGVHTTLTEMRLRGKHKSAWDRWVAEHGPGPHYVICGRDRAKLGAFWRPSFQVARCGNHNGAVVNPDSGRPIVFDDERRLREDFDRQERFAETLESVALCGGEKTKPRRPLYSPLWQVDGSRIRRYAPIEFIGRYEPATLCTTSLCI